MTVEHITSSANALLKDIRKAQSKGSLTADGCLVAEGPHLAGEAERSGLSIACAVLREGVALPPGVLARRVVEIPEPLFRSISATDTPQGILCLIEPPVHSSESVWRDGGLVVLLDALQDPGNAGAIARSAEAFGASGIVFYGDTVNPLHPKTIRASAGSLFRIPFIRCPGGAEFPHAFPIFAGVGNISAPAVWDSDLRGSCCLAIGNEGAGVSDLLLARAQPIRIPTHAVESLNAAVAAGILLYEAARQRNPRRIG